MNNSKTKKITTIGLLCAMAMVLNLLVSFPLVPAVSFLKFDPKDIIIVIGGFARCWSYCSAGERFWMCL